MFHFSCPALKYKFYFIKTHSQDFPGGPVVRPYAANAGGTGSIPGWGTKILQTAHGTVQRKKTSAWPYGGVREAQW